MVADGRDEHILAHQVADLDPGIDERLLRELAEVDDQGASSVFDVRRSPIALDATTATHRQVSSLTRFILHSSFWLHVSACKRRKQSPSNLRIRVAKSRLLLMPAS
jgi:hypothetical protein